VPTTVIRNIGTIVTGDVGSPIASGDTVMVEDGLISGVGTRSNVTIPSSAVEVDAAGATLAPGLIDSHSHPVFGDFTPRQRTLDFIDSCLHGGVTTLISAGEFHLPGRPRDRAGAKALAILAAKSYQNVRPSGVKVLGGAVALEPGLLEEDFDEMSQAGVQLVGEIGVTSLYQPPDAGPMVKWAQARGMRVIVHTGGASVPGSNVIGADIVCALQPDIAAHVNGGPTALPEDDLLRILRETDARVEVVQCGNVAVIPRVVEAVMKQAEPRRLIVGTDMPSGTGVIPLGMLRTVSWLSSLGGLKPEVAMSMATGNTALLHSLNRGRITVGLEADLLLLDAPRGSTADDALSALAVGDTPAVLGVMIDGSFRIGASRNTPPGKRAVSIPGADGGGH
jgi:enamidase